MSPSATTTVPITKFEVDFAGVSDGARAAKVEPGDYLLEVVKADVRTTASGKNQGQRYVNWQLKIVDGVPGGENRGTIYYISTLIPEYLSGLYRFLTDLTGIVIPKTKKNVDLTKMIGKQIAAIIADDAPDKRGTDKDGNRYGPKSEIKSHYPAADFVSPTAGGTKNGKAAMKPSEVAEAVADTSDDSDEQDDDELEVVDDL